MKIGGAVLLIVVIAILIVGMAAAAFLFTGSSAGSGAAATPRPGVGIAVDYARSPNGVTATVTVGNNGSEDLRELRITKADIATLTGSTALPLVIGKLARGASTSLVFPYTGPAPAAKAPLQLQLQYDYKCTFGNGSGTVDTTGFLR